MFQSRHVFPAAKIPTALFAALLFFVALPASAQEPIVERVPTPFVENGKAVTLEIVIFKPDGTGPFPTVMFNHGSTGRGDKSWLFSNTWINKPAAKFFNERGWLVAFPQRRGRGKSDGLYDEGFEPDRSKYSCSSRYSLPGVERALQDLDAVVEYLKNRPDVDSKRMLIGGQSRGGILTIAYAGTRPSHFIGAINFVGGWLGEGCGEGEAINTETFKRGAEFQKPTLWLYGENDSFYRIPFSRKNFNAFVAVGGKGTFLTYSLGFLKNGHALLDHPDLWGQAVSDFVEQVK